MFSKPGKVKYGNVHILAILVSALYRYHQAFVIEVIDNVLERITLGLEQNDFRFNQARIAEVKYLGELYNYKMIDSPVIFDTLYRIVTFGHGMTVFALCLVFFLISSPHVHSADLKQKEVHRLQARSVLLICLMISSESASCALFWTLVGSALIVAVRRRSWTFSSPSSRCAVPSTGVTVKGDY